MVKLEGFLFGKQNPFKSKKFYKPFLDSIKLFVKGGHGGNGYPKFGGIGGQGGAVFFESTDSATLKKIWKNFPEKQIKADNGEDSNKARILGRRGSDIKVQVPCGVTIVDETAKKVIGELNAVGETCIVTGGGTGGNASNQFIGQFGQEKRIKVDLKLIADIGLVGFPNAGKSTLLKALSRANPRIASYPFTTIQPQVGIIEYNDYRQISVADLPGLIEGAHRNVGMGHEFLRHVERTCLLILIVDVFGFRLSVNHMKRNSLENVYALNKELELYDKALLQKPTVLLINKMDLNDSQKEFENYKEHFEDLSIMANMCPEEIRPKEFLKFERIIPISAKSEKEIDKVKKEIRDVIDTVNERHRRVISEEDGMEEKIRMKLKEIGPNVF